MKAVKLTSMVILMSLLWLGSSLLMAQQAKNVVLADFLSAESLYVRQTPFPFATELSLADIWGWAYNGNEYALVCLLNDQENGSGVALVKVTDSNKIQRVKTIKRGEPESSHAIDVTVFGNYAYVCQDFPLLNSWYVNLVQALNSPNDSSAGVSDFPANASTKNKRVHNLQVCAGNSTLWAADLAPGNPIMVYDIRNFAPARLDSIYLPAGPPPSVNRRCHDLFVSANRIYSASNDQGFTIFDYTYNGIGGPFDITATRNHFYNARRDQAPNLFSSSPLLPIGHTVWPSTNGNYLFGTDERNGNDTLETVPSRNLGAYMRTWNISTIDTLPDANGYRYPIAKVFQAREITEPAGSFNTTNFTPLPAGEFGNSIHNAHIKNENGSDLAYISYYTKGLRILDVTNPSSPSELGWYDVPNVWPYIFKVYGGSWGVYPYFTSGAIIVSDARGLYVFRRATEKSGTISSSQTWSGAIFVTNSITVSNNATLTISPGTTVAFADGKSLTVNAGAKIIADGTSTQTIKFTSNSHPPARAKWGNIVLYSTGNVFDYCTVEYGNQSIKILNGGATISNCTFQQNDQGIRTEYSNTYVSNCELLNNRHAFVLIGQNGNGNGAIIYNCHAKDNDRDGIYASGYANGIVKNTHLEQNGKGHVTSYHGVYAVTNCNLTFYDPEIVSSSGLNTIRNNEGAGVYSNNSTINIGSGSPMTGGNNAIFGNGIFTGTYNGKQIYNAAGATVNARWTYWGQGQCPPPSSFFFGNVDRANCLTTSPTGFSKIMAGSDSTMDVKTFITQLKGYLLDQSGVPAGFDSLSTYDALALYFSMIRNDFNDVLQERSQTKSVLQYVYDKHKGSAAGEKAFQSLVGYEMIYGDWSQAEILCEQALTDLTKASHADMLATLIGLELRLGKFPEAQQHFDDYALAYPQEEATIQMLKESFETAETDYENGWKNGLNKAVASSPQTNDQHQAPPRVFISPKTFPTPSILKRKSNTAFRAKAMCVCASMTCSVWKFARWWRKSKRAGTIASFGTAKIARVMWSLPGFTCIVQTSSDSFLELLFEPHLTRV